MTTWQVKIEGLRFDIGNLKKWLASTDHEIVEHDGIWYLCSPEFARFERADDVYQEAQELLAALNALAKVQRASYEPVALGTLVVEVGDGQRHTHQIKIPTTRETRANLDAVLVEAGDQEPPASAPPLIASWLPLHTKEEAVRRAARIFLADRATWGSLYNVFEIIESDVNSQPKNGKKLKDRQWIDPKQLNHFCATVNDFKRGGDTARHQKLQKPSDGQVGMEIAKGERLIRRLLTEWLNSKA